MVGYRGYTGRANEHITHDLSSISRRYCVAVGNDAGLPISHLGSFTISTPNSFFVRGKIIKRAKRTSLELRLATRKHMN